MTFCEAGDPPPASQNVTGRGITEYQRLKRLDIAREMVVQKDGTPLAEIAEICGYQSLTAFSKAFRTTFGITPSNLRHLS